MKPAQKAKYNLTEGGILKKLLLVAVPIMGTQLTQMAYNLTDMFWLGRVGSNAVAAVGSAGMFMWLSFGFILLGRMGAEIGVSQSLGREDKTTALAFSQNAMVISATLGLIIGLVMIFFNKQLISFFNFREQSVADTAAEYLMIVGFGMPINFIVNVVAGTYYASGNSRIPFIFTALGLVINMVLDPVFILIMGMGARGAAIATIIAQIVSGVAIILALFFHKSRPFEKYSFVFKPEIVKIRQLFKWSIPISLESLLFCFLTMITARIEASFGANAIAVSRLGVQIESLSWLIGGGFGSAMVAFVGQNYGARKWERIGKGTKIGSGVMLIWGSLITALFILLGAPIFSIFFPGGTDLIALGRQYLLILAFSQLSMNLEAVAAAWFRGIGRTMPPSMVSITCNVIRPPLALILSRTSLGILGVWVTITISSFLRGAWIFIWFLIASRREKG
ncbi:MAG: MATE family efflux transporter [Treponema sp.]|nr:MATE family efflux transporter [Treponema sp.]